jgi:hypothetical protein
VRGEALRNALLFVGDSVRAEERRAVACSSRMLVTEREEPRDLKPV